MAWPVVRRPPETLSATYARRATSDRGSDRGSIPRASTDTGPVSAGPKPLWGKLLGGRGLRAILGRIRPVVMEL